MTDDCYPLLSHIDSPADLKALPEDDLFMIGALSETHHD